MCGVVSYGGGSYLIRVFDGGLVQHRQLRVFQDPWFSFPLSFKPITIPSHHHKNLEVSELSTDSGDWNWSRIDNILWPIDHDELQRIRVNAMYGPDVLIWHYNSNGM